MSAPVRLLSFAAGLVLVFAAGFGIGAAVGPETVDDGPVPTVTSVMTDHGGHGVQP